MLLGSSSPARNSLASCIPSSPFSNNRVHKLWCCITRINHNSFCEMHSALNMTSTSF
jgi:hypothetical protein